MNRSEQIHDLAAALAKAQGAIEDADKDATNPHFKSKYADLASVRAAIRKPFSDNGLSYVQLPRMAEKMVEVETVLMHASGQFIGETMAMPVQQVTAHGIGSALTYVRRYALMAVAGIAASEDDDDGNEVSRQQRQAPQPQRRAPDPEPMPFDDEPEAPASIDQKGVAEWRKEITACASVADLEALARTPEFKKEWAIWNQPTRDAVQRMLSTAKATFNSRVPA